MGMGIGRWVLEEGGLGALDAGALFDLSVQV